MCGHDERRKLNANEFFHHANHIKSGNKIKNRKRDKKGRLK